MTHQAGERQNPTGRWWYLPELPLIRLGLVLSVAWEFLQSPFYTDTFTASWAAIAFNRLHCAGGDVLILLAAFWLVALVWGRDWMASNNRIAGAVFLIIGIAYTVYSEYFNVHLVQRWAYSQWMPTFAGVGVVPLAQWVVVPALIIRGVQRLNVGHNGLKGA